MTEQLKKYLVLRRVGFLAIQDAVNEFNALGYKVRSYYPNFESTSEDGEPVWYAAVELDLDYSDVTRVADAPEEEANRLLALKEGWEIASTSVSSKFYRMVKRSVKKDN